MSLAPLSLPASATGTPRGGTGHVGSLDHGRSRNRPCARITRGRPLARAVSPVRGRWSCVRSGPGSRSPRPPGAHELLLEVVPLAVQGGAASEKMAVVALTSLPFSSRSTNVSSRVFFTARHAGSPRARGPTPPTRGAWSTVKHLGRAVRIHVQLIDRCALGAERAFFVRAARIALDVHDLAPIVCTRVAQPTEQ